MLKASRRINNLEKFFLHSNERIQFAVEVSKPELVPRIINNLKHYNLALHLKHQDSKFVYHNDPIHVYSLPKNVQNPKEACNFISNIKYDFSDTFSVIAANDRNVAVSASHMVCDGGFFKDLYGKLLDETPKKLKSIIPISANETFSEEISKVTKNDIIKHNQILEKLTPVRWSSNHKELKKSVDPNALCKSIDDESPASDFHFLKAKISLTDMYNVSFALSMMGMNGHLQPNFGINTCVDLRRYLPKEQRDPSNTQNTSIVSAIADDVKPSMTVREVAKLLRQDLLRKLNDNSPFVTYKCYLNEEYFPAKDSVCYPELSNVGLFKVDDNYSRMIPDMWIQTASKAISAEKCICCLAYSKEKYGVNTLVTRLPIPISVFDEKDAKILLKSILFLMKEVPPDISIQEAFDNLRKYQNKIK